MRQSNRHYGHKRGPILLSDEEHHEIMLQCYKRASNECSICFEQGWVDLEGAPTCLSVRLTRLPCNPDHLLCDPCASRLIQHHLRQCAHASEAFSIRCACMSKEACGGRLPRSLITRLADPQLLHLALYKDSVLTSTHAQLPCPNCATQQWVPFETLRFSKESKCSNCSLVWCTRCEAEMEEGVPSLVTSSPVPSLVDSSPSSPCPCLSLPDSHVPGAWSRCFSGKDGMPLRRRQITRGMAQARLEELAAAKDKGGVFSACPTCGISLSKSSACNELHHCGSRKVCNMCACSTLPWEHTLPSTHWSTCPRWDTDMLLPAFVCRENECYGEHLGECRIPSHAHGIAQRDWLRLNLMEHAVLCELGIHTQ